MKSRQSFNVGALHVTTRTGSRERRLGNFRRFCGKQIAQFPTPETTSHLHTTPSPSPSRMYRYAGCDRGTGAIPRLLARDPAVAVVVVAGERIVTCRCRGSGFSRACRRGRARDERHLRAVATGENPFECRGLAPIDGEAVGTVDLEDATGEPAFVPFRDPLTGVLAALLVAVHLRGSECEVPEVPGEPCPG